MFYLLICVLVVHAVIGEEQARVPDEFLPAESGRFLVNKDNVDEAAYYGMRMNKQNGDVQLDPRDYSRKYNQEGRSNAEYGINKGEAERDSGGNYQDQEDFQGPAILRSVNLNNMHENHPNIARQDKIIADVFSPDYHQPTWVLDYRYMKTGGRDYTRGPGGQILILPKNVHTGEPKDFPNYDSLLEHLRLKNLAEKAKYHRN